MWGEFEDDEKKEKPRDHIASSSLEKCKKLDDLREDVENSILDLPLRDRIIHHMAASSIILKSQQRYEPDFTYQERKAIVEELLDEKPGQFLYRITVRNRRYAALQKLRSCGDYFSEKEMERRNPLLYDQLIGKHQTEEEREEKTQIDESDIRFSSILLAHIDKCDKKDLKKQQQDQEDEVYEEEDTDDEEDSENPVESGEKQLFKEEFYSVGYWNFLRGNDHEFDYGQVDTSEEYDPLDIHERDEEERYFDDDDEQEETLCDSRRCCNDNSEDVDMENNEQELHLRHLLGVSSDMLENHDPQANNSEKDTHESHIKTMEVDPVDQCLLYATGTGIDSET
ncbi:coiled-coil domain-containing protein 97 isoform X2 [Panulirus ornatus]|uniref:coiled-coil domain-containing protein 97 isoform X2 n=1 Tax=Panulirus ornatus TaxID=150431 RepID=UPI003A87E3C8